MTEFYNGNKLLTMKDINGKDPEIYMCTSNRSAGKTTYFGRYLVRRFIKHGEKFILLYRFKYEMENCSSKFFKDIQKLFFPNFEMTDEKRSKGVYHELFLNNNSCGYSVALNCADQIKKQSHLFSDASWIFFDEFQSETNNYCPDEINKLLSIHTSIARGQGEQVRRVPVIMCGNTVSIINPYFVALGVSDRLSDQTKFLRGDGYVLEQGYNDCAAISQKKSPFNRAFQRSDYVKYASENIYLKDNLSFIDRPTGQNRYICTIRYDGKDYAVREYTAAGVIYCDNSADLTNPNKIAVTLEDHRVNYVLLKRYDPFIIQLRWFFEKGAFRFKNLQCKEAILKTITY